MQKSLHKIFCICFAVMALSGCCGMMTALPGECDTETPTTDFKNKTSPRPTKADFLKEWGKPDTIETKSENEETWIYNKHIWCGPIPCWGVCAPLVLPVCDGFNRVYFQGDIARRLHTRRTLISWSLLLVLFVPAGVGSENACIEPLPPSVCEKIESGKTVSLSVTIDTPEHQQDEDYKEVAKRLREFLSSKLVDENDGVFKAVVPAPETADYALEVTITSANIPGKFAMAMNFGYCEAHMTVHITNRKTNQRIGDFEIGDVRNAPITSTLDGTLDATIAKAVRNIANALNTVDDICNSNFVDEDQNERELEDRK